jgi:hypothetical protein
LALRRPTASLPLSSGGSYLGEGAVSVAWARTAPREERGAIGDGEADRRGAGAAPLRAETRAALTALRGTAAARLVSTLVREAVRCSCMMS